MNFEALQSNRIMCNLQATGIQYTIICCVCWVSCRAVQLYMVVVLNYDPEGIGVRLKYTSHLISWGTPLFPVLLTLAFAKPPTYRDDWCFINPEHGGVWEWCFFYGPILLFLVPILFFWLCAVIKARAYIKQVKAAMIFIQNLGGIGLLIYMFSTELIHEIYFIIGESSVGLEYAHYFTYSIMGIICFVSFGLTYQTIASCRETIQKFSNRASYEQLPNTIVCNQVL